MMTPRIQRVDFYKRILSFFYTLIYSMMPAWAPGLFTECICSDLLKHDLIALLDIVLPDGVCELRAVVDEVVGPQHVHRGHVASLCELGRQKRELEQHQKNVRTRKKSTSLNCE
jgi:hypothetical protein